MCQDTNKVENLDNMKITEFQRELIWNIFREFARFFGRYPPAGFNNKEVRDYTMKIARNIADSSHQGLVDGISTDLFVDSYKARTREWYYLEDTPVDQSGYNQIHGNLDNWQDPVMYVNDVLFQSMTKPDISGHIYSGWRIPHALDGYQQMAQIKDILPDNSRLSFKYLVPYFDDDLMKYDTRLHTDDGYVIDQLGYEIDYDERLIYRTAGSGDISIYKFTDPDFLQEYGYITPSGRFTKKLKNFIHECRDVAPIYWGEAIWDQDYFDMSSKYGVGQLDLDSIWDGGGEYLLQESVIEKGRYAIGKYGYCSYNDDTYDAEIYGINIAHVNGDTYKLTTNTIGEDQTLYHYWSTVENSGYFNSGLSNNSVEYRSNTNDAEYVVIQDSGLITVCMVGDKGTQSKTAYFKIYSGNIIDFSFV